MKNLFLAMVMVLLFASLALATPFLVCDPQAGVDHYKLTGPAWVLTSVPAQADGSLKLDLATATSGSNSLTVAACITDPSFGEACSATVPFVFAKPPGPTTPRNLKLAK